MAEKLRDAGYPQPDRGMFYALSAGYDPSDEGPEYFYAKPQLQFDPAYAPTATELLPIRYALSWNGHRWRVENKKGDVIFMGGNPHDLSARAWLHESKPVST